MCPSLAAMQEAGDLSAGCHHVHESPMTPESNQERIRFQKLVQQYTPELQDVAHSHSQDSSTRLRLDLLEVFVDRRAN